MPRPPQRKTKATTLRVIAGDMRGRKIHYNGDPGTRPMRDSVRENVFNILQTTVRNALCWDLFAGTAALAIESISRGAYRAVALEQDRTAIDTIRRSLSDLNITDRIEVIAGDTFRLAPRLLTSGDTQRHWVVFVSPPYDLMERRPEAITELVRHVLDVAPRDSQIVVEYESHWEQTNLPEAEWDIRQYGSTCLAFAEKLA